MSYEKTFCEAKYKTESDLKFGRRTFFCRWPRRYQSRDDLADEPSSADGPTPVPEQRCLACHYTKLGRWTYFGWWTPHYQSRDDLHTSTQNVADEPTLANGPPSTRAEMPCIPLHQTWQMNLLWLMDPHYQSRDDLHTTTPNLSDEPTLADGLPHYHSRHDLHTTTPNLSDEPTLANGPPLPEQRWLAYHYTKLGRWTYFGQWIPHYQSRDDLHTTTQNLADEPTLAEHNGKVLKALSFTVYEIHQSIFSKHIFA